MSQGGIALSLQARERLDAATCRELENLITALAGWSSEQHTSEGGHGDVTALSLSLTPTRLNAALTVVQGLSSFGGALAAKAALTAAVLTDDANDYSPAGIQDTFLLRVSGDADRAITGIQDGPRKIPLAGRLLLIFNAGANIITLVHDSSASQAAFRMILQDEADVAIPPGNCVLLYYEAITSRWTMVAGTPGISTGGVPSNTVADLDGVSDAGAASTYSRGDHKHANLVLTADPAFPVDDTWWMLRSGSSPTMAVQLRARIGGVTYTVAEITA